MTFGVGLPELIVAFNHSSQRQTLDYLCVQPEELKCIYENQLKAYAIFLTISLIIA